MLEHYLQEHELRGLAATPLSLAHKILRLARLGNRLLTADAVNDWLATRKQQGTRATSTGGWREAGGKLKGVGFFSGASAHAKKK